FAGGTRKPTRLSLRLPLATNASLPPISRFILSGFNFRVGYGETDYQADCCGTGHRVCHQGFRGPAATMDQAWKSDYVRQDSSATQTKRSKFC
ncbi:hypothetical protein NEOLEDRAFT_1139273, partial [Neolentinus lepideus HHB14362 ss-1]